MAKKKFNVIAEDAFDALQLEAGVLLTRFDPAHPTQPASADIIATTTGGVNPVCNASYSDYGEDVDNVPNNMMEFKQLDNWECSISFSSIKFNAENTQWALGAADITEGDGYKVVKPRRDVDLADFRDIWWVGDKANGGAFAVKLFNAISTGGLSIQSTKNGKGTNQLTITGHVSINAQDVMPMEFYDIAPFDTNPLYTVVQNLINVESSFTDTIIEEGEPLEATLTAATGYTLDAVVVIMNGEDVTEDVYSAGTIEIAEVTGNVIITATAKTV